MNRMMDRQDILGSGFARSVYLSGFWPNLLRRDAL